MAKQIHWTEKTCKSFIQKAMLNAEEIYILENRIKGMTVLEMSYNLNRSEATIHRIIRRIRHKYDVIQKEYPNEFPIRQISKQEIYMDTH